MNISGTTITGNSANYGSAIFTLDGTAMLSNDTIEANSGGNAIDIVGSGVGFSITFCNDTVEHNTGGGIDIQGGNVYMDQFTVDHTINNTGFNILGGYILQNC
jgi:hypothetical protein